MNDERMMALRLRLARHTARQALQRGVTLFEVLVVLAIVAMLGGGIGYAVNTQFQKAKLKQAKTDCSALRQVAMQYIALNSPEGCPSVDELKAEGELDAASKTNDPWNSPYSIACDDSSVIVTSAGPDGQEGTDDDISVGGAAESE